MKRATASYSGSKKKSGGTRHCFQNLAGRDGGEVSPSADHCRTKATEMALFEREIGCSNLVEANTIFHLRQSLLVILLLGFLSAFLNVMMDHIVCRPSATCKY